MRGRYFVLVVVAAMLLQGCMTPAEIERTAVDAAQPPLVLPDTIHVGEAGQAIEFACSPQLAICVAKVHDLHWAVRPTGVVDITSVDGPRQTIGLKGVTPGRAWVIAIGRSGSDSTAVEVLP